MRSVIRIEHFAVLSIAHHVVSSALSRLSGPLILLQSLLDYWHGIFPNLDQQLDHHYLRKYQHGFQSANLSNEE
jgi:hypothetical protein